MTIGPAAVAATVIAKATIRRTRKSERGTGEPRTACREGWMVREIQSIEIRARHIHAWNVIRAVAEVRMRIRIETRREVGRGEAPAEVVCAGREVSARLLAEALRLQHQLLRALQLRLPLLRCKLCELHA